LWGDVNYQEWNEIFGKHFFNPESAGREVLLYVTDDLVINLGSSRNVGVEDFISAVKGDRPAKEICTRALELFKNWRERGQLYPPYLGILCFFVLADVTEGDFAAHGYYPKLWFRLRESGDGEPAHFSEMIELWDDLEKWSREEHGEELGKFVARIRGGRWKIGLPRSQTLLSEHERQALPDMFAEAGLEPGDPPNAESLAAALLACRQVTLIHSLHARTLNLLMGKTDDEALWDALVELLSDELEAWDGIANDDNGTTAGARQSLRIVIEDPGGPFGKLAAKIRIWSRDPYPEDRLALIGHGGTWTCTEAAAGWSTPLREFSADATYLVPDENFWVGNVRMSDASLNWGARQRQRNVRLFRQAEFEVPIRGWLEAHRLTRNTEFLVVADGSLADSISGWGQKSCREFKEIITAGLPTGWKIFRGKDALESHPNLPALAISSRLALRLRGGIKLGRGNTYLVFAPPHAVVEDPPEGSSLTVELDGGILAPVQGRPGIFSCPPHLQPGKAYRLEAKAGGIRAAALFLLEEPQVKKLDQTCPYRLADGSISEFGNPDLKIRGAQVVGVFVPAASIEPLHSLLRTSKKGVLLGRSPDQIWATGFNDQPNWEPVWAVLERQPGAFEVVYCQQSLSEEWGPIEGVRPASKGSRLWREHIWIRRRKTKAPENPRLLQLWKRYQEFAEHV
jgi:hypothetical protein